MFSKDGPLAEKSAKIVAVFGTNRELAEASSCYVKADHEWCGRNIWWFSIYLISFESLRKQIARTLTFAMATSYGCPWRTRPVLLQLHILNSFTCWIESLPISNLRLKKKSKQNQSRFQMTCWTSLAMSRKTLGSISSTTRPGMWHGATVLQSQSITFI